MNKIEINDFLEFNYLGKIKANQNGVTYINSKCDIANNDYIHNINQVSNGELFSLTSFNNETSFTYENNNSILFKNMRDQRHIDLQKQGYQLTDFYRISLNKGEATFAFSVDLNVSDYKMIGSNKMLIKADVDLECEDYHELSLEEKTLYVKNKKDNEDYSIVEQIPFINNGASFTNMIRSKLFIYDLELKCLTYIKLDKYHNVDSYYIIEDKIYMSVSNFETIENEAKMIISYNYLSDQLICELENSIYSISEISGSDDKIIVIASDKDKYGINQNNCFYQLIHNSLVLICDYQDSIGSSVGSDCRYLGGENLNYYNNELYFITTINYQSHIYKLDCNNKIAPVLEIDGSIDCFDIFEDKIYFIGMLNGSLQEVYVFDLFDKTIQNITYVNSDMLYQKYVSSYIHFNSINDRNIDGFVLLPENFDENKKYSAILDIHGGPKTVYGEVYYHEMQVLASSGYVVMFCNPKGSDGKGNEFGDIRGLYGSCDYDDIMLFVDDVLKLFPNVDENNLAVLGGSYGGFMTNWIISHTNRFKCAISQRSISNWISMFGTTDIGFRFATDQCAANMNEIDSQLSMWDQSPLKYASNVTTPTLFIHSKNDYRCNMVEAMQMFTAIKKNNVESRMVLFNDENHELSRSGKPLHRIKRLQEIINWITTYLD